MASRSKRIARERWVRNDRFEKSDEEYRERKRTANRALRMALDQGVSEEEGEEARLWVLERYAFAEIVPYTLHNTMHYRVYDDGDPKSPSYADHDTKFLGKGAVTVAAAWWNAKRQIEIDAAITEYYTDRARGTHER